MKTTTITNDNKYDRMCWRREDKQKTKKEKKTAVNEFCFFSSCFFFSSHSHLGMNTYGLFFFSTSFVRLMLLVRLLPFIQYLLFVFSLWIFLYDLAYRWEGSHCCCCCFLLVACSSIRFLRFYFFFASSCFLLWLNQIFFLHYLSTPCWVFAWI